MLKKLTHSVAFLGVAAAAVILTPVAQAQDFPNRPVKLLVGFPPGSTTDIIGRIVADGLSKRIGQSVVVENKTGGGGMIATEAVARSAPDGHTILVSSTGAITVNPFIYPNITYNVEKDFAPITKVVEYPFILVTNPNGPRTKGVKSVKDLQALAKKQPSVLTYGSAGVGNLAHLAGAQMDDALGVQTQHVPYRGAAPVLTALLAGEIDYMFAPLLVIPQVKAGKLDALAVTASKRWSELPDTPAAVSELNYPTLNISLWTGILAPSGTPQPIVDRLNKEIAAVAQDPQYRETLLQQGAIVVQSPKDFRDEIRAEMKLNEVVVKRLAIKAE